MRSHEVRLPGSLRGDVDDWIRRSDRVRHGGVAPGYVRSWNLIRRLPAILDHYEDLQGEVLSLKRQLEDLQEEIGTGEVGE